MSERSRVGRHPRSQTRPSVRPPLSGQKHEGSACRAPPAFADAPFGPWLCPARAGVLGFALLARASRLRVRHIVDVARVVHLRPDVCVQVPGFRRGGEALPIGDPGDGGCDGADTSRIRDSGGNRLPCARSPSVTSSASARAAIRNISLGDRASCGSRWRPGPRPGRCTSCCPAATRRSCRPG